MGGKPSKDQNSPDYIPIVFKHKPAKEGESQQKQKRFERIMKRRLNVGNTTPLLPATENLASNDTPGTSSNSVIIYDCDCPNSTSSATLDNNATHADAITIINEPDDINLDDCDDTGSNESDNVDILKQTVNCLEAGKTDLLSKISCLEKQILLSSYDQEIIRENNEASKYLTGLSWNIFDILCQFLSPFLLKSLKISPPNNQILMVLVRLRLNLPNTYLSYQTDCRLSTIHNTFSKIINLMYYKLKFLICWSDREVIRKTLPPIFKENFPRLTSIIDCFESFIERPKKLKARAQVYSNYKKHSTVKFLISCSPLGAVNFLSEARGGRATDIMITRSSGFISSKYHNPGDQILADREFTLWDDFAANCNCELITPDFTKGRKQLSAKDVEKTRKIANVRIHVERVIGHMKNRYQLLDGPISINLVKSLKDEITGTVPNVQKLVCMCMSDKFINKHCL